jgi:hypothetical protein
MWGHAWREELDHTFRVPPHTYMLVPYRPLSKHQEQEWHAARVGVTVQYGLMWYMYMSTSETRLPPRSIHWPAWEDRVHMWHPLFHDGKIPSNEEDGAESGSLQSPIQERRSSIPTLIQLSDAFPDSCAGRLTSAPVMETWFYDVPMMMFTCVES